MRSSWISSASSESISGCEMAYCSSKTWTGTIAEFEMALSTVAVIWILARADPTARLESFNRDTGQPTLLHDPRIHLEWQASVTSLIYNRLPYIIIDNGRKGPMSSRFWPAGEQESRYIVDETVEGGSVRRADVVGVPDVPDHGAGRRPAPVVDSG